MPLNEEFARVALGTKGALKAIINKFGGNVGDEPIDQYSALVADMELPQTLVGTSVSATAKEVMARGNMVYIVSNEGSFEACLATTTVTAAEYFLGVAQEDIALGAVGDVAILASMKKSGGDSAAVVDHMNDRNNPHSVTADQVGADVYGSAAQALADAKVYTDSKVSEIAVPDVSNQIDAHNSDPYAHDAIRALIDGKAELIHTHDASEINGLPTSLPASDVYAWAKSVTKPSYTATEVGAAASGHTHDERYYTESEINARVSNLPGELGLLKLAQLSYGGTGTFGSANPTSIVCPGVPKFVVMTSNGRSGVCVLSDGWSDGFVWATGVEYTSTSNDPENVGRSLHFAQSGNVLSWYNTKSASAQCNEIDCTYNLFVWY